MGGMKEVSGSWCMMFEWAFLQEELDLRLCCKVLRFNIHRSVIGMIRSLERIFSCPIYKFESLLQTVRIHQGIPEALETLCFAGVRLTQSCCICSCNLSERWSSNFTSNYLGEGMSSASWSVISWVAFPYQNWTSYVAKCLQFDF